MTETSSVTRPYWIHALTPLHVGAGRGVGFIDLPIMREAVTNWPFVPGSAVKGVLHDHHQDNPDKGLVNTAFGTAGDDLSNSGSLVFTDARLVCLPVRSFYGTFAWCASPFALERLQRDCSFPDLAELTVPSVVEKSLLVPSVDSKLVHDGRAFLEDLDFDIQPDEASAQWAQIIAGKVFAESSWQTLFQERFAVVPEDVFNFLCETATQVDARVRIDQATRTVSKGALWYEESLPAETILSGLAWCGPVFGKGGRGDSSRRDELVTTFLKDAAHLQIGGKATIGRGQIHLSFSA